MRRSPLVALLLSFSFALQLVLARDGMTCVMPGDRDHGARMSVAGQEMAAMSAMEMSVDASGESTPPQSSCDHTSATTACLVMAPCASGFLTIAATVSDASGAIPELVSAASAVMPSSRTAPPEPPPPRA